MKKILLFLLGSLAAALAPAQGDRAFVLTTAGEVDAALADRVRAKIEELSGAVVRLAPPMALLPGQSLEAIGRAAAQTLGAEDQGIIVLAWPDSEQPQGVCLPDVRFGALNMARLAAGVDPVRLERRASQEGLRVMSMLLGMSPCPFPLCVLTGFEKTEDLDHMSGNFCPPCLDRFTRLAVAAGIRMVPPPAPDMSAELAPPPAVEAAPESQPVPAAAEPEAVDAAPAAEPAPAADPPPAAEPAATPVPDE